MWAAFIFIFIVLWLFQLFMTMRQMKHYHQTIREMSKHSSGYLGVGVEKKKLGIGSALIIVTDLEGIVIDCRIMSGVTVFSEFKNCKRFIGLDVFKLNVTDYESKYQLVLEMAVAKIQEQKNRVVSNL
ncbi:transcriptional regulator GutM [Ectobacillus funiculus]|uniref:Transcriptional regulator GutM n=1 Tax=Ectobacillus funiculus TaxID=137993 RepID=A0ABV5WCV4_9BACI